MTSRRQFLAVTGIAALGRAARAASLQSIGVQLYTVRTVLPQKPAETLNAIHAIGYQEIEATLVGFDKIWPAAQASGLKPVSMHLESNLAKLEGDEMARTADQLKQWGFSYAVFPYV